MLQKYALNSQLFIVTDRLFAYRGTAQSLEMYSPEWIREIAPTLWSLVPPPNVQIRDLRHFLVEYYKAVGKVHHKRFTGLPNLTTHPLAMSSEPEHMEIDSTDNTDQIAKKQGETTIWPAAAQGHLDRAQRTGKLLAWQQRLSTSADGLFDVTFPAYYKNNCKPCGKQDDSLRHYSGHAEWVKSRCLACIPGDPQNRDDEGTWCLMCIMQARSYRMRLDWEPHDDGKFMNVLREMPKQNHDRIALSDFVEEVLPILTAPLFAVASAVTLVVLYRKYALAIAGTDNYEACVQGMYEVSPIICTTSESCKAEG